MTHRRLLEVSLAALAIVAGVPLLAEFNAGDYAPNGPGKITQVTRSSASTDATYAVGPYPLYGADLPPGEGLQEVDTYCNACHSPIYITMQPPLPGDTWDNEITKMQKTYGAAIPDDAYRKISRYLQSHY